MAQWPTLALVALGACFLTLVTFSTRAAVIRWTSKERQSDLIDLASSMNAPVGTTLAFLIGFAVSITWGTMSAAQVAIEQVASSSQQLSWLTLNLNDQARANAINEDVVRYLNTIVEQDRKVLPSGDIVELPSFNALDQLERQIHQAAQGGSAVNPEVGPMLSAAAALTGSQAQLNAVARRQLPSVVMWLLLFTATLSAAVMGIVATKVRRPYLIVGWAFVAAIGIAVVLSLYSPFAGTVAVDFQPISDASQRIQDGQQTLRR